MLAAEIGDIGFASRTLELYTNELTSLVDLDAIRTRRFKLVLDYAFGTTSFVMPNVLAKLGADMLGINPNVSTPGVISFDRAVHAGPPRRARPVLGCEPRGDVRPRRGAAHPRRRHRPRARRRRGPSCARRARREPPSQETDRGARGRQPQVEATCGDRLRGALDQARRPPSCSRRPTRPRCDFAANTSGGFVFPQFLPAFDAVATFVRLLSLLAHGASSRSRRSWPELPRSDIVRREVPTPFEQKGLVMRTLVERADPAELVLLDGVKTIDADGWTLVLPDPEMPVDPRPRRGPTLAEAEDAARAGSPARSSGSSPEATPWSTGPRAWLRSPVRCMPAGEPKEPRHGRPRRPPIHLRPRVGAGRR